MTLEDFCLSFGYNLYKWNQIPVATTLLLATFEWVVEQSLMLLRFITQSDFYLGMAMIYGDLRRLAPRNNRGRIPVWGKKITQISLLNLQSSLIKAYNLAYIRNDIQLLYSGGLCNEAAVEWLFLDTHREMCMFNVSCGQLHSLRCGHLQMNTLPFCNGATFPVFSPVNSLP